MRLLFSSLYSHHKSCCCTQTGSLGTVTVCAHCRSQSRTINDEQVVFPVNIPDKDASIAYEMKLSFNTWSPVKDYSCRKCRKRGAHQHYEMTKPPDVLIVAALIFKDFKYGGQWYQRKNLHRIAPESSFRLGGVVRHTIGLKCWCPVDAVCCLPLADIPSERCCAARRNNVYKRPLHSPGQHKLRMGRRE